MYRIRQEGGGVSISAKLFCLDRKCRRHCLACISVLGDDGSRGTNNNQNKTHIDLLGQLWKKREVVGKRGREENTCDFWL